ncbi:PhzF family phenazine biosynthesis protein [Demequina aurantiaca]|uniref:PhzF family phenazine biosynthesis protein n=1 Tax=Demequina aurantiaca TaxID=676200 RepID=UPI0007821520|nr:PhzF family phenazine biosynthesis protein [Demequina aurantiaca]
MATFPFCMVDVFPSDVAFSGNPLAVVLDAEGLSTAQMAAFSAWTNLSECTFVLPPTDPGADYRVRIFSLTAELPFAGHPTLGTARAWLDAGGVPLAPGRAVQECGVGLVPVRIDDQELAFAAPPLVRSGAVDDADLADALAILGVKESEVVESRWVDNGPGWLGVLLSSADAVLALDPDLAARAGQRSIGAVGLHDEDSEAHAAIEVRGFFNDGGGPLREDPVTGSLNASIAQWLTATGRLSAPYVARQGTMLGRDGRVRVTEGDGDLWIGGNVVARVSGNVDL